jgi:outer membrane autotransporter protein
MSHHDRPLARFSPLYAAAALVLGSATSRAATIVVTNQSEFDAAIAQATQAGHTDTIDATNAGTIDSGASLVVPGAAASVTLQFSTLSIGASVGNGTATFGAGTTASFSQPSNLAQLNIGDGYTGTLNVNGATVVFTALNTIVGLNVGADGGTGIVNMTSGSMTIDDANATAGNYGFIAIGYPFNATGNPTNGTFNQSGGVVNLSAGALDVGVQNANGTYNLSGTGLLEMRGGTVYLGSSTGGIGMLNVAGNATLDLESLGTGGQLYVGDASGVGTITQSGAGSTVIMNIANVADFGGNVSNPTGPGGTGTYNLQAGTLRIGGNGAAFGVNATGLGTLNQSGGALIATAPVIIGESGTGIYNLSAGTANFANGLIVGQYAGSVGTINQTGGVLTVSGGTLMLGMAGTATYNLDGGVLQVGGANAITGTGALNLEGGTLQVVGAPLTTAMALWLDCGNSTVDTNGQSAALSGVISGDGGLVKAGQGTLILTAANTYTGGTVISGGTLQIGNGGTTGSITGNVVDNGTLAFDRADNVVFAGTISGTGAVQQDTAASLTLMAPSVYSGATMVTIGTLRAGAANVLSPNSAVTVAPGGTLDLASFPNVIGSLAGGGAVTLGTATLTTGADGTSTAFAGAIAGTGGLTKIGDGALSLTGANDYTGPTSIAGGALQVDGSITSPVTVQPGATLRGTGTIFGNVQNDGTIAPGDPSGVGTLLIAGNYADPSGNVTVRTLLNAGGPGNQITDRLLISGNAVGSTSVTVVPIGSPIGAITGNTPNSGISIVQVGGAASPSSFTLNAGYVGDGPYQYRLFSFAQGVSDPSEVDPRLRALGITSVYDYRLQTVIVAAGQVGPNGEAAGQPIVVPQVATYRALPTAGLMYGQALADDLHRRLGEIDDPNIPGTVPARIPSSQMTPETFVRVKGWTGNFAATGGRPSFDQNLWFMQTGLGIVQPNLFAGGDRLHVGAVLSSGGSDVSLTSNRSKLHFDTTSVGGTATYQAARGWYLDAVLLGNFYSNTHVSTQQAGQAGSTMGTGLTASLEAGYPIPVGLGVVVEPRASATFQSLSFNNFTDTGGLAFHQTDTQSAVGRIGARVLRTYDVAIPIAARLAPFVSVDVTNDFMGNGREQLGGVNFSTSPQGTAMRAGGGVNAQIGKIAAYIDVGRSVGLGKGSASGWDGIAGMRMSF